MLNPENLQSLRTLVVAVVSRLLFTPLAWVVPRDPSRHVVIGREGGKFLDNAKYFYSWLTQNLPSGHRVQFLTRHDSVQRGLEAIHPGSVLRFPSWAAGWALLRAGTVVVDSAEYGEDGRLGLLHGARLVQIWHGAPLKEIELPLHQRRRAQLPPLQRGLLDLLKAITGRFRRTHTLVSTSAFFTEHAFRPCFHADHIVASGYPRNDALFGARDYPPALVELNTDRDAARQLRHSRATGLKTVLYAPTFRQDKHSPFAEGWVDLERLSAFGQEHKLVFAMKLHPVLQVSGLAQPLPHILDISPTTDVYPLLADIDVLVTDYSSIYFDFLLLDRPVVFYPYDLARYIADDRKLLFDYADMTPGPKAHSFAELCVLLAKATGDEEDEWQSERWRVRSLAFDHVDGNAAQRLWRHLQGRSD